VKQNGNAFKYVKTQTIEMCKLSIKQNGYALKNKKKYMKK